MSNPRALVGFAFLLFFSTNAMCEIDDEEELVNAFGDEEIISLATGRSQAISRAPAVATVITAKDIEEMGATNLDQVLETIPGVHMSLSSARFSPIISIRGIHTDKNPQVLMLVNGVPITQLYLGNRGSRSTLPVASIERVEVVRGPGSAIYGADAFAGVINVITKSAANVNGFESGVRYGSFNTQDAWTLYGGHWSGLDVAFSVEYHRTDGDDDRIIESDAQSLFDSILGTNASLAPGPASTEINRLDIRLDLTYEEWRLRAWNWRQNNVRVGPGLAMALDPTGDGDTDNYLVDLTYQDSELISNWDLTARLSYMGINFDTEQTLFPAKSIFPIGEDGNINAVNPSGLVLFTDGFIGNPGKEEDHLRLDFFSFYSGFEEHKLRIATGIHYADLDPKETKNFGPSVIDGNALAPPPVLNPVDGTLTDVTDTDFVYVKSEDRLVYYGSLQDEWSIAPDWNLTAGVRYDHYSDFGSTINPRLALVWEARHDMTSKLLYGRAFRAPSFAELFAINNPVTLGNPELEPEIINTIELAVDYRPSFDVRTELSLFAYKIEDLIRFIPDQSGTSTAENVGNQEGYGFELETEWKLTSELSLKGNYAFQNTKDTDTNSNAGNSPQNQIYLVGKWRFLQNWFLSSKLHWIDDRKRVEGDPRANVDDYIIVDLTLRRRNIFGKLNVALLIHNLFDENAFEPSPFDPGAPSGSLVPGDFPLPGRYVGGELRYEF